MDICVALGHVERTVDGAERIYVAHDGGDMTVSKGLNKVSLRE